MTFPTGHPENLIKKPDRDSSQNAAADASYPTTTLKKQQRRHLPSPTHQKKHQ